MSLLPQLIVNALITGSLYALAAAGLALSYGLLRILNFAHGHLMMVGAYAFLAATQMLGLGVLGGLSFSMLVMIAIAIFSLAVFVLPFVRFSPLLAFVTTLSFGTMLEAWVSMGFGVQVRSIDSWFSPESYEIGGVYVTPFQLFVIGISFFLLGMLAFVVHRTPVGRRIRAVSQHEFAAQSLALNHRGLVRGVFIASCMLAGFSGIMVGIETNLQPTMASSYTIKAFAAMVLGGLGNVWGTIIGSYLLALIENLSIGLDFNGYSIPAGYKDAFAFVIIVLVLLLKPEGLFSKSTRKI